MKATTAKRLAILIAVLGLVGGTGFFTQRYQVERLASREVEKADLAVKRGDFVKAETILKGVVEQRLPNSEEIQIKYADVLLKLSRSLASLSAAGQIYYGILRQTEGREDVRRLLMQLKFDMGNLVSSRGGENGADFDLKILLAMPKNQTDGHLWYLMGRCYEAGGDDATAAEKAVENYEKAIQYKAPEWIEAGERRATLLDDKLKKPKEAQDVIDKLVRAAPKDYRVYLARGRFSLSVAARDQSQKSLESDAKKDFEQAREREPAEPEVYLQLAQFALNKGKSGYDEARQILEDGLEKVPTSKTNTIYDALANLEMRVEKMDKAIETLERGLKKQPEQIDLRVHLTDLLAKRGDSGKLLLQIEELKKLGYSSTLTQFYTACYYINIQQFLKARQILVALQAGMKMNKNAEKMNRNVGVFKSRISVMLAQCYKELGEPEMQQNAYLLALSANPQDLAAKLGWINNLISQGDTAGAIREYRTVAKQLPRVRSALARLLIEQNQRRPEPQRNWDEVKELIKMIAETEPESVASSVLRAELLWAQGDQAAASNELEKAKVRFPKSVEIRIAQANFTGFQGRVDEALRLLDQAQQQLGDQVDLRLATAKLWVSKKGPEFLKVLLGLSQNVEKFSQLDRKRLLNELAFELVRQQDFEGASQVWTRLAAETPADISLRLNLLELALQNADKVDIKGYDLRLMPSMNDVNSMPREGKNLIIVAAVSKVLHIRIFDSDGKMVVDTDEKSVTDKLQQMEGLRRQLESSWPPHEITENEKDRLVTAVTSIIGHPQIEKNIKQIEQMEGYEGVLARYCQVKYLIWQARRTGDKDTRQAIQLKAHVLLEDLVSRRGDWSFIPLASADLAEQELELAQGNVKDDELRAKEESIIDFYLQAIKLGQRRPAVVRRVVQLLFKNGRGNDAIVLLSGIQLGSDVGHQAARFAVENGDFTRAEQIARQAVQAKPDDFQERIWLVQILLAGERQAEAQKELREAVTRSPDDSVGWDALVTFMIFTKQPAEAEKIIQEAEANLTPSQAPMALALCCEKMGGAYNGTGNDDEMKRWNDKAGAWYEKAQAAQPGDLSIKRRFTEFLLRSRQIDKAKKYLEAIREQGGRAKNAATAAWANRTLALVLASGTDRAQLSNALALFEPNEEPVPAGQEGKSLGDPEDLRVLAQVLDAQKSLVHRKRAIDILETLADKNLATPEDQFILARLYEAINDWPRAREKYRELSLRTRNLRDMETLNRRPYYLAQFTESLLRHRSPDDKQDLSEAQELVDQIKQLQPSALGTLRLQVEIYRIHNKIDQAVALIQAVANRPNLAPLVLGSLADLAEKLKQFPLAEQLYRRQATLADTTRNKLLLAAFLGRQGNIKSSLDICEPLWQNGRDIEILAVTCIEILFGSDENIHMPEPAQINRVAGWIDKAIAQAKNQRRSSPLLLVGLGNLRERQGFYPEAQKLYHLAVQDGDRDGVSYNNLAWLAALKDKRFKQALEYANQAIKLKPDQPDFLDTRGMIYLVDGNLKLALEDFQRAVAIDSSSPAKLFHLAQAYLKNNDKEKARQSLDAAKAKGFTLNGLHVLEQENYQNVLKELGSP